MMVFQWVSAHISGFNIGAHIEYAHNILHMMTWSYHILRAIPAINEINALREHSLLTELLVAIYSVLVEMHE